MPAGFSRGVCAPGPMPGSNAPTRIRTRRFFLASPILSLGPLVGEYDWRPDIAIPVLAQAAQGGEWHVRPRDHDVLARKRWQQPIAHRRSRGMVNIEDHRNFGIPQLDNLCMDGVAPKQDLLSV